MGKMIEPERLMIVYCTYCGKQHIDKGKYGKIPHKWHLCMYCGKKFWIPKASIGVHRSPLGALDGMFPMEIKCLKNGHIIFKIEYIGLTIRQDPTARFASEMVDILQLAPNRSIFITSVSDENGKKVSKQLLAMVEIVNNHYNPK